MIYTFMIVILACNYGKILDPLLFCLDFVSLALLLSPSLPLSIPGAVVEVHGAAGVPATQHGDVYSTSSPLSGGVSWHHPRPHLGGNTHHSPSVSLTNQCNILQLCVVKQNLMHLPMSVQFSSPDNPHMLDPCNVLNAN